MAKRSVFRAFGLVRLSFMAYVTTLSVRVRLDAMNLASLSPRKQLSKLIPIESGDRNVIRETWDLLKDKPGGPWAFSKIVGRLATYTGSIGALVEEIRPGYGRVTMTDRPAVRNHLRCVHAIALANLAELAGNVTVSYGMPDDARFIVAGMSLEYVKKARGTITAECDAPTVTTSERREYEVPVVLTGKSGDVVVRATLNTLIGPKKRA